MCENKKLSITAESLKCAKKQTKMFKKHRPVKILFYTSFNNLEVKSTIFHRRFHSISLNHVIVFFTIGISAWI
jgi:hypothetical protein